MFGETNNLNFASLAVKICFSDFPLKLAGMLLETNDALDEHSQQTQTKKDPHMLVEFVVGSRTCSERFFSGNFGFSRRSIVSLSSLFSFPSLSIFSFARHYLKSWNRLLTEPSK